MVSGNTKVVQVTNIAPQATKDQMQTLFGYLGKIEDIRLYPTIRDVSCPVQSRICYVKFVDSSTVGVAQHMTNTVFIDRALIVIPVQNGDIPDEYYALEMTRNGTIVPGFNVNEPKLPPHVVNTVQGAGADQILITTDPKLEENGLPPYPPLPYSFDSIKSEETRRTVHCLNVDPTIPPDEVIEYFSTAGEVKYLRFCESGTDSCHHLLVEFTEQPSVVNAFKMIGEDFKGRPLEIVHATHPIIKPQAKSNEAAQKEIEEAMSRFKEAQNMINASIEPVIGMLTKDKRSSRRSRSRSRGRRRRSRSRSHSHSRSSRRRRSRSRNKSRSRDRERKKRSKSRSKKRSRTRSPRSRSKRSKSRSKSKTRTRQKSKSKERDSASRSSRARSKTKERDRENSARKSRDRSKDRKRGDKERERNKSKEKESSSSRSSRSKDKSSRDKKGDKESSIDSSSIEKPTKRSRSRSHRRSRSKSKDRRRDRDKDTRRRSRSKDRRRRTPSPRAARKRSRSRSSRDRDRRKDKKDKREKKDRSRSRSKIPRNYDEEEKGFDSEKEKSSTREPDSTNEKESSEKSDNMDISNSP